jgi:hypothetical protein
MYGWIWRKLPGGIAGKLLGYAVLIAAVVVVLFLVVFPWASPRLPFNHVTVDTSTTPQPASTAPAVPD